MGAELTEATIPAEAGQWLIDASVSFTKGCYTGQELVARIDSRGGNVPRARPRACSSTATRRRSGADGDRSTARRSATSPRAARSAALGAIALGPDQPRRRGRHPVDDRASTAARCRSATVADLPLRCTSAGRRCRRRDPLRGARGGADRADLRGAAGLRRAGPPTPPRPGRRRRRRDARRQRRVGDPARPRAAGRSYDRTLGRTVDHRAPPSEPRATVRPRRPARRPRRRHPDRRPGRAARAGCRSCPWRVFVASIAMFVAGLLFSSSSALAVSLALVRARRARCSSSRRSWRCCASRRRG